MVSDEVVVPDDIKPGKYVLSWRMGELDILVRMDCDYLLCADCEVFDWISPC